MDRICCFYANEEHLASILLPYIDEKIKENYSIVAMFEKNIGKSFEKIGKIFQTNKETLIKIDSIFMDKPKNDKSLRKFTNIKKRCISTIHLKKAITNTKI